MEFISSNIFFFVINSIIHRKIMVIVSSIKEIQEYFLETGLIAGHMFVFENMFHRFEEDLRFQQ